MTPSKIIFSTPFCRLSTTMNGSKLFSFPRFKSVEQRWSKPAKPGELGNVLSIFVHSLILLFNWQQLSHVCSKGRVRPHEILVAWNTRGRVGLHGRLLRWNSLQYSGGCNVLFPRLDVGIFFNRKIFQSNNNNCNDQWPSRITFGLWLMDFPFLLKHANLWTSQGRWVFQFWHLTTRFCQQWTYFNLL